MAGEGPKTRATAPPKGSGPKMVPAPLARKTEAPKSLRRPSMPPKASWPAGKQKARARGVVERD